MIEKLFIIKEPNQKLPWDEKHAVLSIWHAVLCAIRASHLNTFDPTMSIQHKFDGKLRRQKKGTQYFTSLSLFCDDLETALRDLYGDVDREAVDRVVDAVHVIIYGFSKYVGPDLWKEQRDAERFDLILGIGNDGCGINSSEHARGMVAKLDLIVRACKVKASPSDFSAYTVEFAKRFGEHWQLPSNPMEFLGLSDEMKRRWLLGPL